MGQPFASHEGEQPAAVAWRGLPCHLGKDAVLHSEMASSKLNLVPVSVCPLTAISKSPGSTTVLEQQARRQKIERPHAHRYVV